MDINSKEHIDFDLVRVDARLMHSQITHVWSKVRHFDRILVVNDIAANDKLTKKLILEAAPDHVTTEVISLARLVNMYFDSEFKKLQLMVIIKNFTDLRKLVESGLEFSTISVGNLSVSIGSQEISPGITLSNSEIAAIKFLADKGIKISAQRTPTEPEIDLGKMVREI